MTKFYTWENENYKRLNDWHLYFCDLGKCILYVFKFCHIPILSLFFPDTFPRKSGVVIEWLPIVYHRITAVCVLPFSCRSVAIQLPFSDSQATLTIGLPYDSHRWRSASDGTPSEVPELSPQRGISTNIEWRDPRGHAAVRLLCRHCLAIFEWLSVSCRTLTIGSPYDSHRITIWSDCLNGKNASYTIYT